MPPSFIYLASQSPRRQELLRQIGIRFELLLAEAHEDAESLETAAPGELPARYVQRVTLAKALAARQRLVTRAAPAAPILVADTTVAIGGSLLGKPADAEDARMMLERLSGRVHRVLTAVTVVDGARCLQRLSASRVRFARLKPAQIDRYVASGESLGKAGGYAIQGLAACFVRRIEGSYSGIMGLPVFETAALLRRVCLPLP